MIKERTAMKSNRSGRRYDREFKRLDEKAEEAAIEGVGKLDAL